LFNSNVQVGQSLSNHRYFHLWFCIFTLIAYLKRAAL
jgi:hypothetical protein